MKHNRVNDIQSVLQTPVPFPLNHLPIYLIVPVLLEEVLDGTLFSCYYSLSWLIVLDHYYPSGARCPRIREADLVAIEARIASMRSPEEVAAYITAKAEEMLVHRKVSSVVIFPGTI